DARGLAEAAQLARTLRAAGAKVALTPPQASWPLFLRGANLDVALVLDGESAATLQWPAARETEALDPLGEGLASALAALRLGHAQPLLELISARVS
ncbi:MAG TPA: hypothetical protein PKU97_18435, partial [Kofleriaceae bacterium]|nr:hypothetical protein [Kofleriaceae bacterium]